MIKNTSDVDIDKEIRKRERRAKRNKSRVIPKLPSKVVVIKNTDKDVGNWMESWNKPKRRNIGHIPHSFRLLALGGVGRGKTGYMKQLFLRHQSESKPFKRLYIVTCSLDSSEWADCEPTHVFDYMPDFTEVLGDQKKVKTCIIIDDYEFEKCGSEQQRHLTTLFRMISSHFSCSVLCSYQSFFHCPQICRKTANCWILYKPKSRQELQCIANRVGLSYDVLRDLFKNYCTQHHDMIMLDDTKDTPYPIRKNIYQVIDAISDDDD
jgi:hypothetical protein